MAGRAVAGVEGFTAYRDEPVLDWQAHDLVIRAVDCRAITTSQVPDVVQEWREPNHRDSAPGTCGASPTPSQRSTRDRDPCDTRPQRGAPRAL